MSVPLAKPRLRGWLHLGMAPLVLIAGIVFTAFAPTLLGRVGSAVYTLAAVQLFGTSAAYHRGTWSERTNAVFRRIDHSNIFVFIAGTYTPLALTLLDGASRATLLIERGSSANETVRDWPGLSATRSKPTSWRWSTAVVAPPPVVAVGTR